MFDFLSQQFSSIFSRITGKGQLTEHTIAEIIAKSKETLLEADVPYALVDTFLDSVNREISNKKIFASLKPNELFIKIFHDKLKEFLGGDDSKLFSFKGPAVVMVMGLQGSGKTTSIAKMAYWARKHAQKNGKGCKVLVSSVDFYRPAAVEQLRQLAQQIDVSFYHSSYTEPIRAAEDSTEYFRKNKFDLFFLDTAGRLHIDNTMIQELRDIDGSINPGYKFLILDAMTGQESLHVAQAFDQVVGFNGALLTKMDSETRGGAAFAFRYAIKKPIYFVGTGEKIDELEFFYPDRVAGRILGMGDVHSLIEKAEEKIKKSDQEAFYKSYKKNTLTLDDFAKQMAMVNKIGSLRSLVKYIPGLNSTTISDEMIEQGESEMKKFNAIISSMTPKERMFTKILDGSRKKRIARGAGVHVSDVNMLLQRFEQSLQYVKLFKKMGRF